MRPLPGRLRFWARGIFRFKVEKILCLSFFQDPNQNFLRDATCSDPPVGPFLA